MHIRTKLTASYVVIGLVGCLTAVLVARQWIRGDFEDYVLRQEFREFRADLTDYAARHGGLDRALHEEPFSTFAAPLDATRQWQGQPFRFLVMDPDGTVLFPAGRYKAGDTVPGEVLADAEPVTVDGRTQALVAHTGLARLVREDANFLGMTDAALLGGAACAAVLAALLGSALAWRQGRPTCRLLESVRQACGEEGGAQCIEITSDDELGELAENYNLMSRELARCRFELSELAVIDPQTNLYNRRHFDEQARQFFESARRYEQPMSVMMGDLDHFRVLNDNFSREVGDMVLEKVAELFTRHTRKSDVVARYGGEEFVVLFTNTARDRAAIACENIRRAVEAYPWDEFHPGLKVTISMGLADNVDLDSAASMVSRADQYLSAAKAGGRNQVAGTE
ncbi:diguanylate cyclase [Pseudodesulfovibrio mercurii]|uniref:diguanylate cyclase n=1 Tax=Pseudodesulfovibrio mercurii TaxID=641491 RepID=F0JH89_9BACT|nr:GGDEF domain-containing protein [Pseudodesulfovibrio mercurii]EGB15204.1 diguanylate cyclase [Pseudodesulfovibrio mercurii]